jgi:hypothetical protein
MLLLSSFFRWMLGIQASADGTSELYYFASPWKPWFIGLMSVIALAWFASLYHKDGTRPKWLVKGPLLALRLIAIASVVLIIMQPMMRLTHVEIVKPAVVVLADGSQSMAEKDAKLPNDRVGMADKAIGGKSAGLTRSQIAERMVTRDGGLLTKLQDKASARVYRFAGATEPVDAKIGKPTPLMLDDKRSTTTQIGSALKRIQQDLAGQNVGGVLVISDGGNNLGSDPIAVAQELKGQGMVVSTLGLGDPTPTRDLAVTDVLADQVVRKDNVTQAFVGVEHRGYGGRDVQVVLKRGSSVIGTQTIKLGPDGKKQTATFTFTPKESGKFSYTASIAPIQGEITVANNQRRFEQQVVTKRLKILYIEGEPRWEYRYLKNAILRDKQIEFGCLLSSSKQQLGGEGNIKVFGFPNDEKALFAYDILIIGDVPRNFFTQTQLRNIRRFVEDKGSSLIVISGEKHLPGEYVGSPLEDIFPVTLPNVPEQIRTFEPFQWELTGEGRRDPILRMDDDPARSLDIWQKLPGVNWQFGASRAKPGATVLAVNSQRSNVHGKLVILSVQSFGAGRCLMSTSDSTWKWRYRVGDRYFYRYWGQVIRSMTPTETPGGNRFAQVNADRAEYVLGEQVSLHARLLDSFYRPVKANKVDAIVKVDTGAQFRVTLNAIPGSAGLFSADFLADRVGKFEVQIASPANPSAIAKANFGVESVELEKQQPELNIAMLKRIAQAGGGKYYMPDQTDAWLASLKLDAQKVKSESEKELFDKPALLILCLIALTLEWLIRKRSGLL